MKRTFSILLCAILLLSALPFAAHADALPKVALVVAGGLGDRSFFDGADDGMKMLKDAYGLETAVFECRNDASLYVTQLVNAAESFDIVVAVGWEFWDQLTEIVPEMPGTKFIFIDNGLDGVGDNLLSVVYAQNEGSFLVGYIAGKMTKTNKVGAIGGEDYDTVNDFIVGYEAGVKFANPDATVTVLYTGDFEDPAKGKENALALYGMGCDILFQVAGKTGEGVFEAAAETKNFAIGVDSDQKYINPDVILCSMIKEVGLSIFETVKNYIEAGEFMGGEIWLADMATGFVRVGYGDEGMTQQVPDALKAEIETIAAQIISGEIVVPTAF